MRTENNIERYAKLMQPISRDAGNENISNFMDEVSKLRERYHIPECLLVLKVNIRYADGQVGEAITSAHFGNQYEAESMAAYALGNARAQITAEVNKLARGERLKEVTK
jgi:hypothetical protein